MYKGNKPKVVPIIIGVIVVALIIAALVSFGRMIFGGGSTTKTKTTTESDQIRSDMLDTAIGRAVRFTERGPIIADENFKSYQIVITPTTRTYTTYNGYLDRVVSANTYSNNSRAYEEFVYALDKAYAYKTSNSKEDTSDMRGICATNGRLYVFETVNNDSATHTLWTSTCKGSPGSMGANLAQVKALFTNQVPNFDADFITRKEKTATSANMFNQ